MHNAEKREDILSRFLQVTETDPTYLIDVILNFIIVDTKATIIAWFIYMVCKHPAVQLKIAKEVKEAINMKEITNYAEFVASISEEAIEKMQYLHAAITKTLRLYPAVPVVRKSDYIYCQHFIAAYEILHVFSSLFPL